mgnify:CR=1 FL=1
MEITQIVQKIKILSLYSTKRLFKLLLNKLLIFSSLFLFSCTSHLIQAEEIKPKNLKCSVAYKKILNDQNFMTSKNKNFQEVFFSLNLKDNLNIEDFNLIIISKYKPTQGYDLEINKIIKKGSKLKIFKKEKLRKNATALQVITYPFCLMKVENLEKFKISIK